MKPLPKATPQNLIYLEQTIAANSQAMKALLYDEPITKHDIIAALALADFYAREYHQLLASTLQQDTRQSRKSSELTGPALRLIVGGKYHQSV